MLQLWLIIAQVPTSQPVPSNKWENAVIIAGGVLFVASTYFMPRLFVLVRQVAKLQKLIQQLFAQHKVTETNVATTAKAAEEIGKAVNSSPGPNAPPELIEAARQISETPTIPIEAPVVSGPVANPVTPTVPPQPRAFDGSKPE